MSPLSAYGVTVPDGDPGALRSAAGQFDAACGGLEQLRGRLSQTLQCTWDGRGSVTFTDLKLTQARAAALSAEALGVTARVLRRLADDLEAAQRACRQEMERAEDAHRRAERARVAAESARRAAAAQRQLQDSANRRAVTLDAAGASAGAREEALAYAQQAEAAERETQRQVQLGTRAGDDLEREQRRNRETVQRYEDDAAFAAATLTAIAGQAPVPQSIGGVPVAFEGGPGRPPLVPPVIVSATPLSSAPEEDEETEEGWGDHLKGFGTGIWDGVKGLYDVAEMGVKSSPTMLAISPETFRKQWEENAGIGKNVVTHPLETGKAVIGWDDLANGRYGHWAGNLVPDLAIGLATGGAGAAATRSTKLAEGAARAADDMAGAGAALEKASSAHKAFRTKKLLGKTTASDLPRDPTLSGWEARTSRTPDTHRRVSPEIVREYARRIGHELPSGDVRDRISDPGGFRGRHFASHAEKQAVISNGGAPIGVSRPMCPDCVAFFSKHAAFQGRPQIVRDPHGVRAFMPDGQVLRGPLPADLVVEPPRLSLAHAAAGGGAAWVSGGLEDPR